MEPYRMKILFNLCVHDFWIKYFNKKDVQHLIDTLSKTYKVDVDWSGKNFLGYTINWHYDEGYVDLSMPKFNNETFKELNYSHPEQPQYSPH